MRHAKSDWDAGIDTDFERPLNYRGRKDALKMAAHLIHENLLPELVILSSSKRTTETWKKMKSVFKEQNLNIKEISTFDFYHGGLGQIQDAIKTLRTEDQAYETILVLGHNPGWNNAVSWLSGVNIQVTTANIIVLEHHSTEAWSQVIKKTDWKFQAHFQPRTI